MEVMIDVRKLMTTLEVMNPEADFTLTKVYLFDLAMGKEPATEPVRKGRKVKLYIEPEESEEEQESLKSPKPKPLELSDLLSPSSFASPNAPKVSSEPSQRRVVVNTGKLSRDEKLAKRAEMEQMRDIPTKDLLARLTAQHQAPLDGNQFTGEGTDVLSTGGDLEIG